MKKFFMHPSRKQIAINCLFLIASTAFAQSGTVASGGVAAGSGGSASFSVGQVNYISVSSSAGKIYQGVQQPIEIYTIGIEESDAAIEASLFPNPASDQLVLQLEEHALTKMSYRLFDMKGNLLTVDDLVSSRTIIPLHSLAPQMYFLKVGSNQHWKTFKIIKHE